MSVQQPLTLRFFLPASALRPLVTSYYALETGDMAVDDHLHPEWGNIRFGLTGRWTWSMEDGAADTDVTGDATLFGPTSRAARITAGRGTILWGIGLLPLGWAHLVGLPASVHANRAGPLSAVWGKAAIALLDGLRADDGDAARVARLDAVLLARLQASPTPVDPILVRIHAALVAGDIATVASFAAEVGVSQRTLERLCPRHFGFTPKPLLRRQRFLRTLDAMERTPGRTLIERLDADYFDQAHFVREFHAFMGLAPTAYFARPRALMRLAAEERRKLLGQALQGLHAPPVGTGAGSGAC